MEERVHSMVLRLAAEHTAMSPLCWIAGNTGPMLLTHGARDSERVIRSNQRLRALLQLQPAPVDSVVESGHDHFQTHTMLRDADHPWHARLHQLTQTEKP